MTPEERNLIVELFDRLGTLEDARRDPDAEIAIREGLRQAPNAVYSLVQTVLVQDEALKRADARIRELQEGADTAPRDASFLGNARHALSSRAGSVPSVRGPSSGGMSPAWRNIEPPPAAAVQQQPAAPAPSATGHSFLGTAAAAAAGVIGGSLLLSSIRSMMPSSSHSALDSTTAANRDTPSSNSAASSDLARSVGIDDIGRPASRTDSERASLFDSSDTNASESTSEDASSFFSDADTDLGNSTGDE